MVRHPMLQCVLGACMPWLPRIEKAVEKMNHPIMKDPKIRGYQAMILEGNLKTIQITPVWHKWCRWNRWRTIQCGW
eukprot:5069896-Amphidinium_carterae.1